MRACGWPPQERDFHQFLMEFAPSSCAKQESEAATLLSSQIDNNPCSERIQLVGIQVGMITKRRYVPLRREKINYFWIVGVSMVWALLEKMIVLTPAD